MNLLLAFQISLWQLGLILVIGLGVGALAYLLGRNVLGSHSCPSRDSLDLHEMLGERPEDRRADPRRTGSKVEVDLIDPRGQLASFAAHVFDRSRGGVGLIVDVEVPAGIILNARPRVNKNPHAVPVEVRSCRPHPEGYLLGCQFKQTLPWNILMLFG